MDKRRSHLVVIDMQERLAAAIAEAKAVIARAHILIAGATSFGLPITVTEQYPQGLGSTVDTVLGALPKQTPIFSKMAFSAAAEIDIAYRFDALRAEGRDQAILCGMEAHVCVLQTAINLREKGFQVFVIADAVASRSFENVKAARARLIQTGCSWATVEMAIFEWLERADSGDFRALSALIKNSAPRPSQ